MNFETWWLYVCAITLVIMIPGPLSMYMVSNSLHFGIVRSLPAVAGGTFASVLYLIASATGLGAILTASEELFSVIKLLGAAYLFYLGVTTIMDARKAHIKALQETSVSPESVDLSQLESQGKDSKHFLFMFKKAFLLGASNPKDILFFMAFLPQFISQDRPLMVQLFVISATWILVDFLCKLFYGGTANVIKPFITSAANKFRFDVLTGGIFIVAGVAAILMV